MSDSGFREIQLSGKQVVFLFIASVVLLVSAFLLGVRTGRGAVPADTIAQATPTPAGDVPASGSPGALPPPTTPARGELKYHETLQGKSDAKGQSPTPTPAPAVTPAPPIATPTLAAAPKPTPTPTAKPAAPLTNPPTLSAKPASATAVWFVQVGAFGTMDNAQRELAKLKDKGFTGSIFDAGGAGARYKVRTGLMERAAADAARARLLKEGFKPSPVSR